MFRNDLEMNYISEGYNENDAFLLAVDPFSTPYSVLLDNLRLGALKDLLHPFGINLYVTMIEMEGTLNGKSYLIDLIGRSEHEIVVVFACPDLNNYEFERVQYNMAVAMEIYSSEKNMKLLGGVAFQIAENNFLDILEKQGFFLIRATGSSSSIINQDDFKPKIF